MKHIPGARRALPRARTLIAAAGLAGAASGALAAAASVVIGAFTATTTNTDPAIFMFAPSDFQSQVWDLSATTNGGAGPAQTSSGSVGDWNPIDRTAQTPASSASVSSVVFTDVLTQLMTPGFTLSASATTVSPPNGMDAPNQGRGNFVSAGGFCFGDGNNFDGTSAGCNAAGEITLTVFYDLIAELAPDDTGSAVAAIGLHVSGGGSQATLDDHASTWGSGSQFGQSLTFTLNLGAGESARFSLIGNALAQVPEPGALALAVLGVAGIGAARRRRVVA